MFQWSSHHHQGSIICYSCRMHLNYEHEERYTITKIVLNGLMYTIKKLKTLVTYEIAHSLDVYGNCNM
jgi:hypothetical protein